MFGADSARQHVVGEAVAQGLLGELADAGLGHLVDEHDVVGQLPLGDLARRGSRCTLVARSASRPSSSTTQASGRSPHFGSGTPITAASRDLRVGHQLVLQLDRGDPLAARLDEVLGAVDEADPAPLVHRRDVAGAQPAVVGEALAGPRVVVVRRPRSSCRGTAARRSTRRPTAPRRSVSGLDDAALDAERRSGRPGVRRSACSSLGQRAAGRRRGGTPTRPGSSRSSPTPAGSAGRVCSRYASDSAFGHRRAAARDRPQRRRVAALQLGQHLHPDRRHAGGDRDLLVDDQVGDRRGPTGRARASPASAPAATPAWARPHALAWNIGTTGRIASDSRAPSESAVIAAHRVQERAAVAVDDALRVAGGAARVAHARGAVLVVDVELDRRRPRPAASS